MDTTFKPLNTHTLKSNQDWSLEVLAVPFAWLTVRHCGWCQLGGTVHNVQVRCTVFEP